MSLELYVSNDLKALSDQLIAHIRANQPGVFQPVYIVNQTEGMNNWLRLNIADEKGMGIAANINFLKPNDLLNRVYKLLGGTYTEVFTPDNMCWLFYTIMGTPAFKAQFRDIADYFRDEQGVNNVKQLALAEQLADLMDQYQVYRPDFIEEWNTADSLLTEVSDWQEYVWRRAREIAGEQLLDKTKLGTTILKLLQQPEQVKYLQQTMPTVYLFGLSILTPYHLRLIDAISEVIDIVCYIQNPAPEQYWFDTISERRNEWLLSKKLTSRGEYSVGNDLLLNWGKVTKDTFSLFFENEKLLNAYTAEAIAEPKPDTLLHQVQYDIFNNQSKEDAVPVPEGMLNDGSIVINSCYTPVREVEVLYNYLVHLLDQRREQLSTRDIIVMVSDINAYAPYIRAVFDNAPYKFRYGIADESYASGDNMVTALSSVLELKEEDFKAEHIVQLLEQKYIRRRFGISNLSLIRTAIDKAVIRFGIHGNNEDETRFVSWTYGLKKMMYGICMSGEDAYDAGDETLFPLELKEGNEANELIRFYHFVEMLIDMVEQRKAKRTVIDWVEYIQWVLKNMIFEPDETMEEDYELLQTQLENYSALHGIIDEELSFEVFVHHFVKTLGTATRSTFLTSGGITFCTMIPMRSIPYKVVAVLGLNFDKFPRKETPQNFNKMYHEKRRGDRNVRESDKLLFLETVLSARQYLSLSYIGQSTKDNATLPPSAIVDELIDYLETRCPEEDARKTLVVRHPLHNFSRKYNQADRTLYNYFGNKPGLVTALFKNDRDAEPMDFSEVALRSFIRFFKHPLEAYYSKVLNITYGEDSDLLSDTEMFEVDKLTEWSLKHELLAPAEDIDGMRRALAQAGQLPLKNVGGYHLRELDEKISPVRELYLGLTACEEPAQVTVDLVIGDTILKATLDHVFDRRLIFICFSKGETKYLVEAYIKYLVGRASEVIDALSFVSGSKEAVYEATPISAEDARRRLAELLGLYRKGFTKMLPFHPDFKITPDAVDRIEMEGFRYMVKDKLENFKFPCTDEYLLDAYREGYFDKEETFNDYKEGCALLITPLASVFPTAFN